MRYVLLAMMFAGTSIAQDAGVVVLPDAPEAAAERIPPAKIMVEIRVITGPASHFSKLNQQDLARNAPVDPPGDLPAVSNEDLQKNGGIQLVSAERTIIERQPVFVRMLDDKGVRELIRVAEQNDRSNVMFAPRILVFERQEASVEETVSRPFVTGLKLKSGDLEPQIDVMKIGSSFNLRATTVDESIKLDVSLELSDIGEVKTRSAGPANMSLQVPKLKSTKVALSALVEKGKTLVITGLQQDREIRTEQRTLGLFKNVSVGRETIETLVLVTPRVVDPSQQDQQQ